MTLVVSVALLVVTCILGLLCSLLAARVGKLEARVVRVEQARVNTYGTHGPCELCRREVRQATSPDPITAAVRQVTEAH